MQVLVVMGQCHGLEAVAGLAFANAQPLLIRQGFKQGYLGNAIGMLQRGTAEIDQRGRLLCRQQIMGLGVEGAQSLQPPASAGEHQHGE